MRTDVFCIFVVVLLVFSPVAFAEIIYDHGATGEGNSWGASMSALANGYNPEDSAYGGGYQSYYTTEAGSFEWSYTVYARVFTQLTLFNGNQCEAEAFGAATASVAGSGVGWSAFSYQAESGYGGALYIDDDPEPAEQAGSSVSNYTYFDASQGIYTAHIASLGATAVSQSASSAYASVETSAYCAME